MNPSSAHGARLPDVRSRPPKDNAYVFGYHGFVYTSQRAASAETVRHPGVLLLSADRVPFEVTLRDGRTYRTNALAVGPRVARRLMAHDVALISINVLPSSAWFHVLRPLRGPHGVAPLDREGFAHLDELLWQLHTGHGDLEAAATLFAEAMAEARRQLPPVPEPDPLALAMVRRLDADPHLSVDDLAAAIGQTAQWVTRTFASALDMSMRDYQNWLKQRRVFDLLYTRRSLTEVAFDAGFGDSPQFSRTFQRWYGQSPSYSRNPKHVRIFMHRDSEGLQPLCFRHDASTTNRAP